MNYTLNNVTINIYKHLYKKLCNRKIDYSIGSRTVCTYKDLQFLICVYLLGRSPFFSAIYIPKKAI